MHAPDAVARAATAAADTETAVALLREWLARSQQALVEGKLTPSERARIGELATNAAQWLAAREEKVMRLARLARRDA